MTITRTSHGEEKSMALSVYAQTITESIDVGFAGTDTDVSQKSGASAAFNKRC